MVGGGVRVNPSKSPTSANRGYNYIILHSNSNKHLFFGVMEGGLGANPQSISKYLLFFLQYILSTVVPVREYPIKSAGAKEVIT